MKIILIFSARQTVQTKFDAAILHERPDIAAETGMVDDGSGAKEVFRVDHFQLVPVGKEDHEKLYSGDCYVVLYAYHLDGKDNYIIYYWLGNRSSQDERGTAALKTIELDNKLAGKSVQVRIVQGKEPPHFLAIFGGKLRIYQGGWKSTFDGNGPILRALLYFILVKRANYSLERNGRMDEDDAKYRGEVELFQVFGHSLMTTYAVQVPPSANSLNTNDCFVMSHPKECVLWYGKGSTGDEREIAKMVGDSLSKSLLTTVFEGLESGRFWDHLGGKKPYYSCMEVKGQKEENHRVPRLFHCSNATGIFRVEEILAFTQRDLVPEDIMMLDVGVAIFIWVGSESNDKEKAQTLVMAGDYLSSDPSSRDSDIPIITVKQGSEPPNFTGHFGAWDSKMWDYGVY